MMESGGIMRPLRHRLLMTTLIIGCVTGGAAPSLANTGGAMTERDCSKDMVRRTPDPSLIDPDLLPLARMMPRGGEERTAEKMPAVRAGYGQWFAKIREAQGPLPADVTVREVHIPGENGAPPIRALIYAPKGAAVKRPVMLDVHGGSWILGFPEMNDFRNGYLAHELGMVIVSIDYRLAPEHPYPAAVDDAHAALAWINDNAAMLGIDPARLAVAGDSAGGAIAGGLVLRARDEGRYRIAFQLLTYPAVGDDPAAVPVGNCAPGTAPTVPFATKAYLGKAAADGPLSAYAVPALATSLAGSPPTFIAVGSLDYLAGQSMRFAGRLISEGVPTELHVYPGAFHGFDMLVSAPVTGKFHEDMRDALRRGLK